MRASSNPFPPPEAQSGPGSDPGKLRLRLLPRQSQPRLRLAALPLLRLPMPLRHLRRPPPPAPRQALWRLKGWTAQARGRASLRMPMSGQPRPPQPPTTQSASRQRRARRARRAREALREQGRSHAGSASELPLVGGGVPPPLCWQLRLPPRASARVQRQSRLGSLSFASGDCSRCGTACACGCECEWPGLHATAMHFHSSDSLSSPTLTQNVAAGLHTHPSLATGGVLMLTILPEANQEADGAIDEGFAMISLL